MASLVIRKAEAADADLVIRFVHGLAEYEKLEGPTPEGEARIREHGWGADPRFEVLLAFEADTAVGFAIYFYTYSTFAARPSLYLEDLFVYPEFRGRGYGKALLVALAAEARERADQSRPGDLNPAYLYGCADQFERNAQAVRDVIDQVRSAKEERE